MPDIFLSYCREDQAIARRFAEGLEQEGFDVWWDQALNAGESFDQVTERTLKEARAVVVLWTRRSVQSRWVRSEATLADRYGTLVPVMLEPCDRPIMFELTHTADLAAWNGDRGDKRWQSFVAGLRRQGGGNATTVPAPTAEPRATSPAEASRRTWLRLAAAATGVMLVAGLAWWLVRGYASSPTTAATASPARDIGHELGNLPGGLKDLASGSGPAGLYRLTDFEGTEEQAAISPDGTLVAFISDRDGQNDVWITRVGTNEFRNLTQGRNIPQFSPETSVLGFSPDGSQVHFTGEIKAGERTSDRWTVPVLGGAVRPLMDGAIEFAWAPDGKSFAYRTSEPGDPVSVRDATGDKVRQLLVSAAGEHNHFPTWSPDGTFLYFLHGTSVVDSMAIWRVPAAGGTPEQLTSPPKRMVFPVFVDARTLAFLAEESRGAGSTLHLLDVESREMRAVRPGLERFTSLAASRSGRRLVATVSTQRSSLWSIPIGADASVAQADRLRMSTRGGSSPRRLGDKVLYVSTSEAGSGLWRSEAGSASEIWSPTRGSVMGAPSLEPGGQRIAFTAKRDGVARAYVGNADGTGMRALATGLQVRGSPAWSPDGKWLAISVDSAEGVRLYKFPVDGGEPVRLTDHHAMDPTWSPQGGFIVYAGEQVGPLFGLVAVTADGQPHALPSILLPRGAGRTVFFPSTDAAPRLLVRKGDLQTTEFWEIDLATSKERQLSRFGTEYQLGDFDLSSDGREILFDRVREESDVVLIDLSDRPA
jgi:Tol biopolymer transport system component